MHRLDRPTLAKASRRSTRPDATPQLLSEADKAAGRLAARALSPGVALERLTPETYRVISPHRDHEAWIAMICDAFGTRSESTARTFLHQLTKLCELSWQQNEDGYGGAWMPDETQLNMILNLVAGIKPKNEMQAALAAQMVAVHLLTMKVAEHSLAHAQSVAPQMAGVAGKLARTFAQQTETLAKLQGRRTARQKITVRYENHEHQHVHMTRGRKIFEGQPQAREGDAPVTALLCKDQNGSTLPGSSRGRNAGVPNARRKGVRSAKGRG